jgi:putative transposase
MLLHSGYSRRHPHRLDPVLYQVPFQDIAIVICTKESHPILLARDIPWRVREAIEFNAQNNGVELVAWSIMPDHLHAVARVAELGGDMLKFIHGFKKRTGRTIHEAGILGPVWLRSFWDRHRRQKEPLSKLVRYVALNPVEEGLCARWQDWPHSWINDDPRRYGLEEITIQVP